MSVNGMENVQGTDMPVQDLQPIYTCACQLGKGAGLNHTCYRMQNALLLDPERQITIVWLLLSCGSHNRTEE